MADVLQRIVERTRADLEVRRRQTSIEHLRQRIAERAPCRDFEAALRAARPIGLIAEIKRASPSAGLIREDFDPVQIARTYVAHGANCLSVLTDEPFFQGSLQILERVRAAVDVPLLRKDFIVDEFQLLEARAAGADCVLLIAEILNDDELSRLYHSARDLGMQTLIEIYEAANAPRVLALTPQPTLVGVNNRNLRTFQTDLEHCLRLRTQIPREVLLVGESGIHTREDVERLAAAGVGAMLVGESLMRSPDIGIKVDELLGRSSP